MHVTLSPSAGSLVGVPPFDWVLEAGKVHPPPPAQQLEPTAEVIVQVTDVSAVWPATRKSKEPTAYPKGSGTSLKYVETVQTAPVGSADGGGDGYTEGGGDGAGDGGGEGGNKQAGQPPHAKNVVHLTAQPSE